VDVTTCRPAERFATASGQAFDLESGALLELETVRDPAFLGHSISRALADHPAVGSVGKSSTKSHLFRTSDSKYGPSIITTRKNRFYMISTDRLRKRSS